jgi:hypothetical protein
VLPEAALVRFAAGPDGSIVPDAGAKLPGRGVWVRAEREAVTQAVKRNAFARSLKHAVTAAPDLPERTEAALARRVLERLGLARRAGALALGFEAVESAVRSGSAKVLIEASDAAADGREKILRRAQALEPPRPVLGCFAAAELGMALGRDRVVHACVLQDGMAQRLTEDMDRLGGFRALVPAVWPNPPRSRGSSRNASQGDVPDEAPTTFAASPSAAAPQRSGPAGDESDERNN